MLYRDSTAESGDAVDRAIRDRLRVIEEPVQPVERDVAGDALVDVERAADRLVVGGVQSPRPPIRGENPYHVLELALHLCRHVRARLAKILEVRGRKDEHLAGAVVTEIVVPLLVGRGLHPVEKIFLLALRLLREEVVGEADRELPVLVELSDDGVVVRIVLEAAAGVDGARHAEPIQLAHELTRGIQLILERQLGSFGQRRVQDAGVGLGQQQTDWDAAPIAYDLAARGLRGVLGIADRPQGGGVQECAVIEVQQEDGRLGSERVDLLERRQSLLGELMLGEAADHAHPLGWRRDGDLLLQHLHRIGKRADAVPAQLHVETESGADDVKVVVDQAWQDTASLEVDHPGCSTGKRHDVRLGADA